MVVPTKPATVARLRAAGPEGDRYGRRVGAPFAMGEHRWVLIDDGWSIQVSYHRLDKAASDPLARESFRHTNFLTDVCMRSITGLGARGYILALDAAAAL